MYAMIVNFHLKDLTEDEYRGVCDQLAPAFAEVPTLISKVWLADRATNTYGGIYLWPDRASCEEFKRSDLFASVEADPHLVDMIVRDFDVIEAPTRVTRGLVSVVA